MTSAEGGKRAKLTRVTEIWNIFPIIHVGRRFDVTYGTNWEIHRKIVSVGKFIMKNLNIML